jgi:putative copper export protein
VTEPVLAALQQWVLFSGVVLVVGCVAWRVGVAPRAERELTATGSPTLAAVERRAAGIGLFTTLLLVAAWMLRMVVQVMGFRDPFVPLWEDVSFLLFELFWGTVWLAQGVTLVLLAVAFGLARQGGSAEGAAASVAHGPRRVAASWYAAGALTLALVATLALSGHAMGVDAWRPLIVTADGMHTLAAGVWIGSLGVILTAGRAHRSGHGVGALAAQLRSFSPMAVVGVAVVVSMGIVLAWTHLSALSDLWTMTYGRLLAAKTGLAGAVLAVGLWNWRQGIPIVDTEAGASAVQRRATWEVSFAVGVLLLTAVLVHSTKP